MLHVQNEPRKPLVREPLHLKHTWRLHNHVLNVHRYELGRDEKEAGGDRIFDYLALRLK